MLTTIPILFSGEDPNAKFLALVKQREANSTVGWWKRKFGKGGKVRGEGKGDDVGNEGGSDGGVGDGVIR